MSNPFKPITIIALYLLFVLKWGPKWMENRQPYKLHFIIKCYNLLQVVICLYISIEAYRYTFARGYSIICQPVDFSMDPSAVRIAQIGHYYFLTKVMDLLDTIFFVLKKKNSHVSFLHVYHHAGMVALTWIGTKYLAGGHSVFTGLINSCVHVIMYFYYYLTTVDDKYKQSFWKKYITQLQMVMKNVIFFHSKIIRKYSNFLDSIWMYGPPLAHPSNLTRMWISKMDCLLYAPTEWIYFHPIL